MTQVLIDFAKTYTNAEFEALPTDGRLLELIEGKVVEKMPGDTHGRISRRLNVQLALFDPDEKAGVLWPGTTVDLGAGWLPIPDLLFIKAERVPPESEKSLKVIPDLVVEIHSPSNLDSKPGRDAAQAKIAQYLAKGVQIVWAINPREQTVEIYYPGQNTPAKKLGIEAELDGEQVIPGFKISLKKLFE